jgi:hypothetical protein
MYKFHLAGKARNESIKPFFIVTRNFIWPSVFYPYQKFNFYHPQKYYYFDPSSKQPLGSLHSTHRNGKSPDENVTCF